MQFFVATYDGANYRVDGDTFRFYSVGEYEMVEFSYKNPEAEGSSPRVTVAKVDNIYLFSGPWARNEGPLLDEPLDEPEE